MSRVVRVRSGGGKLIRKGRQIAVTVVGIAQLFSAGIDDLGDAAQWLTPGLKIQAEFFEGAPIGIDLPPSMELTVTRTEPTMKGATVSNVNKPAILENGVTVTVPPFVNEGDRIRVDPTEGRYIERAK